MSPRVTQRRLFTFGTISCFRRSARLPREKSLGLEPNSRPTQPLLLMWSRTTTRRPGWDRTNARRSKMTGHLPLMYWTIRRERDLNPGTDRSVHTLSKRAPSTARPSLHLLVSRIEALQVSRRFPRRSSAFLRVAIRIVPELSQTVALTPPSSLEKWMAPSVARSAHLAPLRPIRVIFAHRNTRRYLQAVTRS